MISIVRRRRNRSSSPERSNNTRARGRARPFILYHAKRLEFALHYFTALESLYKVHDPAARNESLEAAVEGIYNALNAYADVARDLSKRTSPDHPATWVAPPPPVALLAGTDVFL